MHANTCSISNLFPYAQLNIITANCIVCELYQETLSCFTRISPEQRIRKIAKAANLSFGQFHSKQEADSFKISDSTKRNYN